MSTENVKKIHLIYGCITAVLVVIVAICLIVSCVGIYQSGDRPFSREVIAQAFRQLAVPGWLCLVAVVGGIALQVFLPLESPKTKAIRDDQDILNRYSPKFGELTPEDQAKVKKEIRLRKNLTAATAVIGVLLAVYPVIYYADVSHFGIADLSGDIVKAILVALIPTAVMFAIVYIAGRMRNASVTRQIGIYKTAGVKPGKGESATTNRNLTVIRGVIIAAALLLIALGIFNEGYVDVLGKAIKICTECIGLG